MRWTRKSIVAAIKKLHGAGVELNYATAEAQHLNLVRAAAWHFGTWRRAVEAADIDYESIGKYRRWDRERIVARIKELAAQGADLSWRSVSVELDPPLAAAALRPNGFNSWREAIAAAGLNINEVARYQLWDEERVVSDIKALHRARVALSSKAVQTDNQPLFCAARRRFGSWDGAIEAAGISTDDTRMRRSIPDSPPSHNGAQGDKATRAKTGKTANATKPPLEKPKAAKKSGAKNSKRPASEKPGASATKTVAKAPDKSVPKSGVKAAGKTTSAKPSAPKSGKAGTTGRKRG